MVILEDFPIITGRDFMVEDQVFIKEFSVGLEILKEITDEDEEKD